MRTFHKLHIPLLFLLLTLSCKKILDTKPIEGTKVLHSLDDCQALLDDERTMNGAENSGYSSMKTTGADEYYSTMDQYRAYTLTDQQACIWARQIYTGDAFPDWDLPYRAVYTANLALSFLRNTPPTGQLNTWNCTKGRAFFYRAYAFFDLSQVFAPAYDSSTAAIDWGIPLRLTADPDEKIVRAHVQQTYDQILEDLRNARSLIPKDSNWLPTRPTLAAVFALYARVFLSVRNYPLAGKYADSCLQIKHELMEYDTISAAPQFSFNRWNPEVVFTAYTYRSGPAAAGSRCHVDSGLFRSYAANDLRKRLFFKDGDYFYGTYDQDGLVFAGITTSEMYLTRSECFARAGNTADAMADLNHLLQTRWAAGAFVPYVAANADDALLQVLQERKKELLFRGTRWTDLRRLHKDTLTRVINGVRYSLPPNDPRWVLPIPSSVIFFNPQMPQNDR